ncbi:MAG TPA: thioesterase [Chitinophagaceae bacterium]|nr:thioesterase [Chitinophagaceae bacterium]
MNANTAAFIRLMKHPLKFRFFLLSRLPSAYFTGVRIKEADEDKCITTVPYKWFSKNPFRSTYFASLAMAAEMSTGTLALIHLYRRKPSVSMLLTKLEAGYFKKATSKTSFICNDGQLIRQAIEESVATGEPRTVRARSTGTNGNGEIIAEFFITWSFKARKN